MKYKKIIATCLILCFSIGLIGCVKPKGDSHMEKQKESFKRDLPFSHIVEKKVKEYEIESKEFDLGKREYGQSFGKTLPYLERGWMSIPKGDGKFPVVLLAHGSHENLKEKARFDKGFRYATEFLAKRGIVAISMDLNMVYNWSYGEADTERIIAIVNQHIQSLKSANSGQKEGYSLNLQNKLDFENLILVGHSRSGHGVFDVAEDQLKKGQKIKGIVSLAPAMNLEMEKYPDITTGIIVPEYDGDVVDWQGYSLYESLVDTNHKNPVSLILLKKANHNYFNTDVKPNDAKMIGKDQKDQLTREEQQEFLANYLYDFVHMLVSGEKKNTPFNTANTAPSKMYGREVSTKLFIPSAKSLIDLNHTETLVNSGVKVKKVKDSWFYQEDEAIGFESLTFGNENKKIRNLLEVSWEKKGGNILLNQGLGNLSEYQALNIELALDPANQLNQAHKPQTFSVVLEDKKGNESTVILGPETITLSYVEGKLEETPIEDEIYRFWSHYTPLMSARIPLPLFEKVNLKEIVRASIVFDQNDSGSIMVEKIELQSFN